MSQLLKYRSGSGQYILSYLLSQSTEYIDRDPAEIFWIPPVRIMTVFWGVISFSPCCANCIARACHRFELTTNIGIGANIRVRFKCSIELVVYDCNSRISRQVGIFSCRSFIDTSNCACPTTRFSNLPNHALHPESVIDTTQIACLNFKAIESAETVAVLVIRRPTGWLTETILMSRIVTASGESQLQRICLATTKSDKTDYGFANIALRAFWRLWL